MTPSTATAQLKAAMWYGTLNLEFGTTLECRTLVAMCCYVMGSRQYLFMHTFGRTYMTSRKFDTKSYQCMLNGDKPEIM